jgi:myosin heavy subunit
MVAGGRGHGAEASSSRVGRSAPGEGHVSDPPAFADAQEEQELWVELRDHGAVLNRALNEALRIHGGPAWRVFQVRRRRLFSLIFSSSRSILAARRSQVSIYWRQELEHRAPDKYGAFDQMSVELLQLREQCDAFDALADALRTPDSWLSYRAEALHDQLQESERQAAARPSIVERVCTALIDRDEALRQARGDLERMRTLAINWEAEVAAVCSDNLELHSLLRGVQAQQSQAEERTRAAEQRAKEADELKATLNAKVAALSIAEDRLLQERTARQGAEGQLQQERAALADARSALKRERIAREAAQKSLGERNAEFSKLEGELVVLSITSASQEQALKEQSDTVNGLQQAVEAERRALEVEKKQVEGKSLFVFCFADFPLEGSSHFLISLLLATFRPTHRAGARDRSCRGAADLLQLL